MSIESYDVMPVECAGCDLLTYEPHTRNHQNYCARCAGEIDGIVGTIEPVDQADVMIISGYFANLPRQKVERIYRGVHGDVLVDVVPAGAEAFERIEPVTYVYSIVERTVRGETAEYVSLKEYDE